MSNPHQQRYQTPRSPTGTGGDPRSSPEKLSFSPSGLPAPIYNPDEITPHDHYRFPPQPMPRSCMRDVGVLQQPPGHPIQQDLTTENTHLRERISQLEHKLQEKERKMQEKEKQASELDMQEEYVRKLFEARVAVMGFKCRQMQLQGEVDYLRGMVNKPSETELQAQLEKMKTEKIAQDNEQKSLLTVIQTLRKDIQNLEGRASSQDDSELQRLQQVVGELQQENARLRGRQRQEKQQPPSTQDEQQHMWVVKREEIHLTSQEVGRGGWAVVQVAKFRGLPVAAKSLYLSQYNRHLFIREMNTVSRLRHPNLVQFIGATIEGKPIILSELMHTSLRATLERGPLNAAQITSIGIDVARALNYLHLMRPDPIIHRDVSSTNVLLNPLPSNGWRAKVSDYASVSYLQHLKTAGPGNPTYAAPEANIPKLQSPKMDVFSYGVLLLEMWSQRLPDVKERAACLHRVQQQAFRTLIQYCLEHQPEMRPDMYHVLEHFERH